ncbi:hypothetical protein OSK03_26565, partial [Escherichia coli]|nr:hypothetical protein [Escherichia coli]
RLKLNKAAPYHRVEKAIIQALEDMLSEFKLQNKMKKPKKKESLLPLKEKALLQKENEKRDLEKQRENIHDLLEQGIYTIERFMERQQILSDRAKDIQRDIDQLNVDIEREKKKTVTQDAFIPIIEQVLD